MKAPSCHPERPFCAKDQCHPCYEKGRRARKRELERLAPRRPRRRTPEQRERRNAAERARRAALAPAPVETFPLAPLLAFAAGKGNPPITAEELAYRLGLRAITDPLTDVEADHCAVALGRLPGDIWPEWYEFDGPHALPSIDHFGTAICQCHDCMDLHAA